MRRWYYLSNVRRDRFALETRSLPSYYPGYGTSTSQIVVTTFDVRFRSSFIDDDKRIRRKEIATIAAWSIFEDSFDGNEKCKAELIQLGKTTLVREQDCKLVQGLIKEANNLVSLTLSTFLKTQDRFVASLYLEQEEKEEQDKDPVIEISFSNSHQFEHGGSEIQDHFGLTTVEHDSGLYHNERMYARLAHLAADTSILFHSRIRNIIPK